MRWMAIAAVGLLALLASGCGGGNSIGETFVSTKEARSYIEVFYGTVSGCEGREKMTFAEWQLAGEPKEAVWDFVLCRIERPNGVDAKRAGIFSGQVLSYGIP